MFTLEHDDMAQVTPSSAEWRNSSLSIDFGGVRLHRAAFSHGVQIRRHVETGNALAGVIARSGARVTESGINWGCGQIALVEGALDLYTTGPSVTYWLEAPEPVILALLDFGAERRVTAATPRARAALTELTAEIEGEFRLRAASRVSTSAPSGRGVALDAIARAGSEMTACAPAPGTRERYRTVREAERLLWSHLCEDFSARSLAAGVHCSVRTLQSYFGAFYEFGPLAYFRMQRLNAARRAIARERGRRSIIDIAADLGFLHHGHFSAAYRQLFGTTPSASDGDVRWNAG